MAAGFLAAAASAAGNLVGTRGTSTRGMNIRGGNLYTPGSPAYNAQEEFAQMTGRTVGGNLYAPGTLRYNSQAAFEAMTANAEKNIIRDPVNKGVLGYTEAAGVTPLPGQTVNIYDPSGTNILRTQSGPALPQPGGGQGSGLTGQSYGNMPQQFDFSGFQNQMAQYQNEMSRMQSQYQNQMQRLQYQNQPSRVASVQTPSSQQRRMGSIGSSFGRGGMQIKSVNV